MTALLGNTYPIKDKLKDLGGKWDKDRKLWLVPDDKFKEASEILKDSSLNPTAKKELTKMDIIAIAVRKRGGTPGICFACGGKCKYPYDECWDCKEERDMGY